MKSLRYILCLLIVTMASAFGVNMAFAVPMGTSEITYPQTENTHSTAAYDVGFAARAPPMAVSNVEITGGVTGMSGSTFALHGQETVTALLGFDADLVATNTGPLSPRVNISDDLTQTVNNDGFVQYVYRDANAGHGIEVTLRNGKLEVDIAATGDSSTLGSGTDMFNSSITRLQNDGHSIDAVQGVWIPGTGSDNFAQFNQNLASGMSRTDAAQNTWTGQIAASHGFTEVIETTRSGSVVVDFEFVRPQ